MNSSISKSRHWGKQTMALAIAAILAGVVAGQAAAPNTPEGKTLVTSKVPVDIAKDGKALIPIVISPASSPELKATATELATYLKRITGAGFAVEEGKEAKGITLGTLEQFPDEKLKEPLAIRNVYDGLEAYAIQSEGGSIRLIGNTDLGVTHAAYRFLELMGCRWFFPGKTWELVPQIPNLSFDLNETSRPEMLSRILSIGHGVESEHGEPSVTSLLGVWARENRLADSLKVAIRHMWSGIPEAFDKGFFKKDFEAHPEYFALVNGKRTSPQFCVTNPGLQKLVIDFANKYLDENPTADMVPFDPADGPGYCTCPECAKLGEPSSQAFYLANIVAKAVQKTHPGKFVGLLAYSWHSLPPDFAPEPNVYVELTFGANRGKYTFEELLNLWGKKCNNLGIYEYFSVWASNYGIFPGGRAANLDDFGRRYKNYIAHNVKGIAAESVADWGLHGLGYYIANRVMWDTSVDVGALKKDFYNKAFGPAAPAMERYFERVNAYNKPLPGKTLLVQCADDLEEASSLAKSQPDIQERINALKGFVIYNYLTLKSDYGTFKSAYIPPQKPGAPDAQATPAKTPLPKKVESEGNMAEGKENVIELLKWAYRTRNTYMEQWTMLRSTIGHPVADLYDDPSLFWRKSKDNPWRSDEPVTPQEIEQRLKAMKADIGEPPAYKEPNYSDQMTLVQSGRAGGAERKALFVSAGPENSTTYLMASTRGEPLRFKVSLRTLATIERPDARYVLTDSGGQEILKGSFAGSEEQLELKVPKPGIYNFTCNARDEWEIDIPRQLNSALKVGRGESYMEANLDAPLYFYVPKGTSEIVMYPGNSESVLIRDPQDQVVYDKKSDGTYISIPVKKSAEGKVWSIGKNKLRMHYFWFLNIPTIFSSNPDHIFLPQDLAAKDGLTPVTQ